MMRLDKFLALTTPLSRKESALAVRRGHVTVNGIPAHAADGKIDETADRIQLDGTLLVYRQFKYIMLNKPEGYVSSTDDPSGPTVLELLPEELRRGLFPCGRLDKNTTGLLLLTDNGPLSHRLLSPKSHVAKEYSFTCERPVTEGDVYDLEKGVDIGDYRTKPTRVTLRTPTSGVILLEEGKYHQIKLMFKAKMNKILTLKRISFAGIPLDERLEPGEFRFLTPEEEKTLEK